MACAREDPVAGLAPRGRSTSASHHRLEAEAERERMPVPAPDRGERQQSGAAEQICIRLPLASPLLLAQSSCPSGPLQVQKDDGPARLRTGLSLSGLLVCYWVRHSMMPFQEPVPFLWQFLVEFAQRGAAGLDRGQRADGGAQDLPGGRAHPLTEAGDEAGWLPIRISCQLLVIRVPHS